MLPLLSGRAGGMEREAVRSGTKPLCMKAWVVKVCCTLRKICAALWHVWENSSLSDMSEQTPHLPSWLLMCTWGQSDQHPQASLFGGTGNRKMQAQGPWKEPVLRCSWKQHLVKMVTGYSCLRDLTSTWFGHLSISYLWTKTQPLALRYVMRLVLRFLWQTSVTLKPSAPPSHIPHLCLPQPPDFPPANPQEQNSHAHCSQIDVAPLSSELPGGGPGLCFSIQLCISGPHTPDVWEFALDLTLEEWLVNSHWVIQNCFLIFLVSRLCWILECFEHLFVVVNFLGVLLCLSGSCILELSFILYLCYKYLNAFPSSIS